MLNYLITDPKYYTDNPITFKEVLTKSLSTNNIDIACFRDKVSSNTKKLAEVFVKVCKEFDIKTILINSDLELVSQVDANGVHLNSTQFDKIKEVKDNGLFVVISCHNLEEILQAQENGANMVTYSPIFSTPNKGEPKGCKDLENILEKVNIPVIALGGIISQEQINEIKKTKAIGFASIRYFLKESASTR